MAENQDPKPDSKPESEPTPSAPVKSDSKKSSKGLKARWASLSKRNKIIIGSLAGLVLALLIVLLTPLKYPIVGLFHDGQVTLTVVDDTTHQPIPDAQVGVGKISAITGKDGQAKLSGLDLGKATVTINKHAYNTKTVPVTLFWSPANLGDVAIHSDGVIIKFSVTDSVSTKPITAAKVTIGNASAVTTSDGTASVSLEPAAVTGAAATITADGYNAVTAKPINKATATVNAVNLVPTGKVYFFSNRSGGHIDLYSSNLDGSGQTIILKGSGNEDAATGLLPSVSDPTALAIVSSRAGQHTANGALQHDLYIFDTTTNKLSQIQTNTSFADFRGWIGTTLVYVVTNSDNSASIKAYDSKTKIVRTLSNIALPTGDNPYVSVNGLGVANNKLYYSVSSSDSGQSGFYYIGLSGGPSQLDPGWVNQAYRQTKTTLDVSLSNGSGVIWKSLNLSNQNLTTLPGEPSNENDRGYADSPDGKHSIFVETRDGKSQLYLTDGSGGNETALTTSGYVNQFVQWYSNRYVAYSTNAAGGSAIYIVSIDGGPEKKVADFFQGNGKTYGGGYNPAYF